MTTLAPAALKSFFDANAGKYKSAWQGTAVLADGYLPTVTLNCLLCMPNSVANPQAQANVPKPFTAEQLFSAISAADALKVVQSPMNGKLLEAIAAQAVNGCNVWIQLCAAAGYITAAEQTTLQGIINATQPDPNWQATVPAHCDLQANFTDALGHAYDRLEDYRASDGSFVALNPCAYIAAALGRNWP